MGKRYVVLTDPDDGREGEVRFGGRDGEDGWEGGQLIFRWEQRIYNGQQPRRVERIVELANEALENRRKK